MKNELISLNFMYKLITLVICETNYDLGEPLIVREGPITNFYFQNKNVPEYAIYYCILFYMPS